MFIRRSQFQCFEPPTLCTKRFRHPKARRNHLIHTHGYPARYFFAVVNRGIGGLIERYGPGASLLRPQWKPRSKTPGEGRGAAGPAGVQAQKNETLPGQTSNSVDAFEAELPVYSEPSSIKGQGKEHDMDVDLDALTSAMAKSSLDFVPPSVRKKKNKEKPRAQQGHEAMVTS